MAFVLRVLKAVLAGWVASAPPAADRPAGPPRAAVEFRRAEAHPAAGLTEAAVPGSDAKVYLHARAELTGEDVARARVVTDERTGSPSVEVTFTAGGRKKIGKLTAEHRGKPLAVLVDGRVVVAPVVNSALSDQAVVTGNWSAAEAGKVAAALRGGK